METCLQKYINSYQVRIKKITKELDVEKDEIEIIKLNIENDCYKQFLSILKTL